MVELADLSGATARLVVHGEAPLLNADAARGALVTPSNVPRASEARDAAFVDVEAPGELLETSALTSEQEPEKAFFDWAEISFALVVNWATFTVWLLKCVVAFLLMMSLDPRQPMTRKGFGAPKLMRKEDFVGCMQILVFIEAPYALFQLSVSNRRNRIVQVVAPVYILSSVLQLCCSYRFMEASTNGSEMATELVWSIIFLSVGIVVYVCKNIQTECFLKQQLVFAMFVNMQLYLAVVQYFVPLPANKTRSHLLLHWWCVSLMASGVQRRSVLIAAVLGQLWYIGTDFQEPFLSKVSVAFAANISGVSVKKWVFRHM